ncbi:UL36 very large tegument protein, partial [Streptomyces sp. ISL-36]|nr:UL36 very large tegument protein [Streptomyces sp. ISL-36]
SDVYKRPDALLCEAAAGPPAWLPALAAELHRVGLGADWATLLWEAASLPPDRLASVAGALADAGRAQDCDQLLRQGVARPVEELAGACAALQAEGHHREAHALLTAFVRVRTPEDAARLASADPHGLVPQLLHAARAVSPARERDVLHALRVAGLARP